MIRITRLQAREIDRRATDVYRIPSILLMENAARSAADVACEMLPSSAPTSPVLILAGPGNNGGDGLAIARHLHNRGLPVTVALCADPARYRGDALVNYNIVHAMRLPTFPATPDALSRLAPSLVIDAIFGTGLEQRPRDPFPKLAAAVAALDAPLLAIDLPSGLDADTGLPLGPCIRATRTVTFVAHKTGFAHPGSPAYTGPIAVADIGIPPQLLHEVLRDARN